MRLNKKTLVAGSMSGVLLLGQLAAANGAFASDVDRSRTNAPTPRTDQLQILPEAVTGLNPRGLSTTSLAPTAIEVHLSNAGKVTGTVTVADGDSKVGISVNLVATLNGEPSKATNVTTDESGKFSHQFQLTGGTWKVVATAGSGESITTATATATIGSKLKLTAKQPKVKSLNKAWLTVKLTDRGHPAAGSVKVEVKEPNSKSFKKLASSKLSTSGILKLSVRPWMKPSYRVTAKRNGAQIAITEVGATTPTFKAVKRIKGMPEPRVRFPVGQTPVGKKSNTVVRSIPNSVWRSMQGLSWRRGCVARSRLALVETNYIGFDGYRHRGKILVQRAIGKKTKKIFTRFYNAKFPIRQMQLVDVFGKNVAGRPGANDYKSMAADNTSAFNCRFVVGKEGSGTRSPHASGRSLDINTWENPYVVGRSVFPNRSYLNRRAKHPGMFKGGSKSLKIMRSAGCRWGGSYADYHHFDC